MISAKESARSTERQSDSVWDYVSPSRLNLWLKCPLAFKLRYKDGVRTRTTASLFLGKQVHEGLEVYYRRRQLGVTLDAKDVTQQLLARWDQTAAEEEMQFTSASDEAALKQQAVALITTYLEQLPADEPRPVAVETTLEAPLINPLSGEDLGIPLLGIVDLVAPSEEGAILCDFKTASKSSAPLEITHEVQLSAYAYLYRQVTGRQEAGLEIRSLIKTKIPRMQRHPYAAREDFHFRRLFTLIRAYLDDLDAGCFVYRPGMGCSMCDFRDKHCRHWRG